MAGDFERFLAGAEDFVRRNLRSGAAREARKRQARRKVEALLRRLRRAALLFLLIVAALLLVSLRAPLGLLWLLALPMAAFAAFLSLFYPERGRRRAAPIDRAQAPLDAVALWAEEMMVDATPHFPGRALAPADEICARLDELRPCLAALPPLDPLAGEARRLIGRHLPHLVEAYLSLPASRREPGGEASRRFADSLATVADELAEIQERAVREKVACFETQSRFIAARYGNEDRLRAD